MRSPFALVLLLGLALAGTAVWLVQGSIAAKEAELAEARAVGEQVVPLTQVWATATPLRYGEAVREDALTLVDWPAHAVPEGAYVAEAGADALFPEDDARPRLVLRAMDEGEIVLAAKVSAPGGEAGITARLEPGMRAFSIRVDEATGVSGFLRPGDLVDVFWTGRIGETESTRLVRGRDRDHRHRPERRDGRPRDAGREHRPPSWARPPQVGALTHAQEHRSADLEPRRR